MCSIVNGKIKDVKDDAVRFAFRGTEKLSIPSYGQSLSHLVDRTQSLNRLGRRLDRRTTYLYVLCWIYKVLPLDIIGTDFSLKLVDW